MRKLAYGMVLFGVIIGAFFLDHRTPHPEIISFTSDRLQINYEAVEAGTEAVNMSWNAIRLSDNDIMRMEAWVNNQWVLIGEGFEAIKTDRIVISHPLAFEQPHYRLSIVNQNNQIIDEEHLYLDYESTELEPLLWRFMAPIVGSIPRSDLQTGTSTIPVNWEVIERGYNHQIALEQLIEVSGDMVGYPLLDMDTWQPRRGIQEVALRPTDSDMIILRLSVIDRINDTTITEGIITVSIAENNEPVFVDPQHAIIFTDDVLENVERILITGQERGNDTASLIRVGDSNVADEAILCNFQWGNYDLGTETYLLPTIEQFTNALCQPTISAGRGFNTASVLDSFWADSDVCESNETPLSCDIRVNRPAYALVYIGVLDLANTTMDDETTLVQFTTNLNVIIQQLIDAGVVPIMSTFPTSYSFYNNDLAEIMNDVVRDIAQSQQLPLIDLRDLVENYPNSGVNVDGFHMSSPPEGQTNFTGNQQIYVRTLYEWLVLDTLHRLNDPNP